VLKTKIEHFYGSQEKHDLQLVRLVLDTEGLNEKEALENGWLIHESEWYACRSVRLNLNKFKPSIIPGSIKIELLEQQPECIDKIYDGFLEYKGYTEKFDIHHDLARAKWLLVSDEGNPVAFTKMISYDGGIESQFTCWNYHKPKMSLGKLMFSIESNIANELGYEHLYVGQGYEIGSAYKSSFKGFEWWTGADWSSDIERYKTLCARDSTINTLEDLAIAYRGKY